MPAKSKKQQRFMGMVHAYQKGELDDAPASIKKAAGSMTKKAAKDFAKTKHKGLPEKVKETVNVAEDFKTMTFKEYLEIDEGILSFARGAAGEVGRKVAGSAPVRAVKDVVAAGRAASLEATKKQAAQVAAQAVQLIAQLGPQGEKQLLQTLQAMGQPGELGIKLYMRGKTEAGAQLQAQQQQKQPQQKQPQPQQKQQATPSSIGGQSEHFKSKPKYVPGAHGPELAFAGFDFNVDGKDVLKEAIGAFIGGAAKAAKEKVAGALNRYAEQNPLKGFGDIWQAGVEASKAGAAKKKIQAIAKQLVRFASALYKPNAAQQAASAQTGTQIWNS